MSRIRLPAALAGLLLATAVPADVLVTKEGAQIETRGAWTVQGRMVVFTLPNGTLSSLRSDAVDLDASARATASAIEAATAPAEPAAAEPLGEPVLRITEADIPPMTELGDDVGETGVTGDTTTSAAGVPLEVVSWDKLAIGDNEGVAIFGTLRNTGRETIVAPSLSVSVYGEEGGLLALDEAEINVTALPAAKSANFRAEFPGLPDFAAVRFLPSGRGYEGRPAAGGEDAASEADAPEYIEESVDDVDAEPPL